MTSKDDLLSIKEKALLLGSNKVKLIKKDLGALKNEHISEIVKNDYDLFINVASSTSNLNDENIFPEKHHYYTTVDLTNPLYIAGKLLDEKIKKGNTAIFTMVFISTILSRINSPNNNIYSSYKTLQEEYIKQIKNKYKKHFSFLLVYAGSRFDREIESKKTVRLARAVNHALKKGKTTMIFGFEGKILLIAQALHPIFSNILIYLSRLIKKY